MRLPPHPQRKPCTKADLPRLAEVLAAAYLHYPEMVYYFEHDATRLRDAQWLCYTILKVAYKLGEVYTDPDYRSCLALVPPGIGPAKNWEYAIAGYWQFIFRYGLRATRKIITYNALVDAAHKQIMRGRPHYHLWILAVDPNHQSSGLGTALVRAVTALADSQNMPVFLETHTLANARYYGRFGFSNLGPIKPRAHIPFWPMVREPQSAPA